MLNGIDISSWQSGINIAALTTTDFVIVKATGGTSYTSDCLTKQADAALAAGKLLGLYHYAREQSCKGSAEDEAQHFVDAAKPYIGKAILILDWEEELSSGEAWALSWLNQVKKLTGVNPLFYCYQAALETYQYSKIAAAGYKLWLAQYASMNTQNGYRTTPWQSGSIGAFSSYIMHQYSSKGRITGYSSDLDLDQFRGGVSDWKALCKVSTDSTTPASSSSSGTVDYSPSVASGMQYWKNSSGKTCIVYSSTRMDTKVGSLSEDDTAYCWGRVWSSEKQRWMWLISYYMDAYPNEVKAGFVDDGGSTDFK